jgi:putative hydrolase of the HAD superfamily
MKFVFDFGGVLFRWRPVELLQVHLPQHATDENSARHWVSQFFQGYEGDWGEFDRGSVEPEALILRIAQRTGLDPGEVRAVVEAVPEALQPVPQTVELLREVLAGGHSAYFLSNMPAPYARHLEATHDFLRLFSAGVFSGRVGLAKPDPAIFELAAARFGAAAEELVFLDDHGPNVEAALRLGWRALQFSDAAQAGEDLRQRGWM